MAMKIVIRNKEGSGLDKNWIPTSQAEITIGEKKKNEAEGDSVR